MSVRDTKNQAMTKNPNQLVIGVMQVRIGPSVNAETAVAAGLASATPATDNTLNGTYGLGALKSAALSVTPTTKEHQSGYPKLTDLVINEAVSGTLKVEMEEIGAERALTFIDAVIASVNSGVTAYYSMEARALFATGSTLSLFSNYCYLKPQLQLSLGQDFNVAPFEFELLYNPAFTYNKLLYWAFTNSTAGRLVQHQAVTKDAANLQLGYFQVRVGRPTPRPAWAATTGALALASMQKVVNTSTAAITGVTGTYTAPYKGKYTIQYGAAGKIDYVTPEGVLMTNSGSHYTIDGSHQVTIDGLVFTFSNEVNMAAGEKWEFVVDPAAYRGPARRVGGSARHVTNPAFKKAGTGTSTLVPTNTTSLQDGLYTVTATLAGGANTGKVNITKPDGTTTGDLTLNGSSQVTVDGATLTFNAAMVTSTADVWELRVESATKFGQTVMASVTGAYAGAIDGAYVISFPDVTHYTVVSPSGATIVDNDAFVVGTPEVVTDGGTTLNITFYGTTFDANYRMIVPVYSSAAQSDTKTNVLSAYPILDWSDSIGSVQNTSLAISSTMKEHASGYPAKKDLAVLETASVELEVTMEELAVVNVAAPAAGAAKTVFEAVIDAVVNSTAYFAPVELVGEMATGGKPIRLWYPSMQIVANFELAPGDDWGSTPFKMKAVRQTGLTNAPNLLYRMLF